MIQQQVLHVCHPLGVPTFTILQQVIQGGIALFIAPFIIAALVPVDPLTARAAAAAFALIYVLIVGLTRQPLAENSDVMGSSYDERSSALAGRRRSCLVPVSRSRIGL